MSTSHTDQISKLEHDFQANIGTYKDTNHLGPVWQELSSLKSSDGANFQQDLVQINKDLHGKGLLPNMEIVDNTPADSSDSFSVVNLNKLDTDLKQAVLGQNPDMSALMNTLSAVEKSTDPAEFKSIFDQLNKDLSGQGSIVESSPGVFNWQSLQPPPDSSTSGSGSGSDSGSSAPSEGSWIDPNGSSGGNDGSSGGGGGASGGGRSSSGGGGGGSDSSVGGSSGGGSDSSAGSSPANASLGDGPGTATTAEVVKDAEAQVGTPYVFDTASPGKAFDCSGLTMWAWAQAGVNLPHNADAQYNDTAHVQHVPLSQLQPGDLLFYNDGGSIHHVTMYVGNGKMIEAPEPGKSVQIVPVRTYGLMPEAGRPHK